MISEIRSEEMYTFYSVLWEFPNDEDIQFYSENDFFVLQSHKNMVLYIMPTPSTFALDNLKYAEPRFTLRARKERKCMNLRFLRPDQIFKNKNHHFQQDDKQFLKLKIHAVSMLFHATFRITFSWTIQY